MASEPNKPTAERTDADFVNATVSPQDSLHILSRREIEELYSTADTELYQVFRRCALAVMNTGSSEDDTAAVLSRFKDFAVRIIQRERGIKLELENAPVNAFVDGIMVKGIKEHLFAVLRDILFQASQFDSRKALAHDSSATITDGVFNVLRNADALIQAKEPNLVVCWGGHSIGSTEYDYTKLVGYELGLRDMDICTGCGPGAMKGPMKGAAVAHRKQRINHGRYIGISEPGIIAAESPNPLVNKLIIMPDIEKRLEAFVRLGHGIVVFPGGVGTAEEIFYLLGLLLHEDNRHLKIPLIFTAPEASRDYFTSIDRFIRLTLGDQASKLYKIVIDDPVEVAREMKQSMSDVMKSREVHKDAYYFNWSLTIPEALQKTFEPTHENMAGLILQKDLPDFDLAVNLRAMFSGIVAGNVKAEGLRAIEEKGNFQISGDKELMASLDSLLESFVEQKRMKINASQYRRCYDIV